MPLRLHSSPFDDPVVQAWDAYVAGDHAGSARASQQTFLLLEQLTALDTPVEIDAGFLEELETRLFESNDAGQQTALPEYPPIQLPRIAPIVRADKRSSVNRRFWRLSAAALLAVTIFGAFTLFLLDRDLPAPREIPAAVESVEQDGQFEPQLWGDLLFAASVDPALLGGAPPSEWDSGEFRPVTIPAGEAFATDNDFFQCCSGISVYRIQDGRITVTAEGRVEVYPAASKPIIIEDGRPVEAGPGDAIVMAMETVATFANDSTETDASLLHSMFYAYAPALGEGIHPNGYSKTFSTVDMDLAAIPADRAYIDFESVELAPGELLPIDLLPSERILGFYPEPDAMVRIVPGAHDELPPGERGTFLVRTFTMGIYDPGQYTLFNASETAATMYLVRVAPFAPLAIATPAGQTQPEPHTTLLDIEVDPANLGAQGAETWNRMEFSLVTVAAGNQFTTDHPYFTCCNGIATFQVREGIATFIVNGPIDVYDRAGEEPPVRIEPGTLIPLEAGQTAVFAMEAAAVVTNFGDEELVMLGAYAYEYSEVPGANSVPPGYRDPVWVVDHHMDPLPAGPVDFEVEAVSLEPGELTHVDINSPERLVSWHTGTSREQLERGWDAGMSTVRLAVGALQQLPEDPFKSTLISSFTFSNLSPGTYTLVNTGTHPANLHFMRLSPTGEQSGTSVAASASPVAEAVPIDTLFDVTVDPLVIDSPAPQGWTRMEFTKVHVDPGSQFTTDHPYFTCCHGALMFVVHQGTAEIEVKGSVQVYRAGEGGHEMLIAAENTALETGDAVLLSGETAMTVANSGSEELVLYRAAAFDMVDAAGAFTLPDGYRESMAYGDNDLIPLERSIVRFIVREVTLESGQYVQLGVTDDSRVVGWTNDPLRFAQWFEGSIDPLTSEKPGTPRSQFSLSEIPPGEYTVFNDDPEPLTIAFLEISDDPASDESA